MSEQTAEVVRVSEGDAMKNTIIVGDVRQTLQSVESETVQCCVTSPPYWGLRDYGHEEQIGLEATPEEYVARMVEVFREVRRVLRDDGTLWLNLGDSYASSGLMDPGGHTGLSLASERADGRPRNATNKAAQNGSIGAVRKSMPSGLKPKDLVGIPWRVAFALQADGWWLRQDIIWHKPNPMPESVRDRCTKSHEYVFLLTKSERYFYDAEAVSEAVVCVRGPGNKKPLKGVEEDGEKHRTRAGLHLAAERWREDGPPLSRNRRSVWTITTKPYSGAHFAVMPPELAETCILAGSRPGDLVLDPFGGSGTTAIVAAAHGRDWLLCELNPTYAEECAWPRIKQGWNPETKQAKKALAAGQRRLFE